MQHKWRIIDITRNLNDGLITTASYQCKSRVDERFAVIKKDDFYLGSKSSDDSDFIEYNDLTEDTVLSWVTGSIDVNTIQTNNSASLALLIAEYASRTEGTGLPW